MTKAASRAVRRPMGWTLVAVAALAAIGVGTVLTGLPSARGYALYHGWLPLEARITGHADDLPAGTARCAGCHDAPRPADPGFRSIPPLDRATLTTPMARRRGPESAYDLAAFCSLLRDGKDPAFILVERTMPRFRLSDGDCAALWDYVSRR